MFKLTHRRTLNSRYFEEPFLTYRIAKIQTFDYLLRWRDCGGRGAFRHYGKAEGTHSPRPRGGELSNISEPYMCLLPCAIRPIWPIGRVLFMYISYLLLHSKSLQNLVASNNSYLLFRRVRVPGVAKRGSFGTGSFRRSP